MDNYRGIELNQLSRFVFKQAARYWQYSIALEVLAGLIGLVVSLLQPSLTTTTYCAILAVTVLVGSHCCRVSYESKYDAADTMRRQSVLSEGLGWPISDLQFRDWKSRAGRRTLNDFAKTPRDQEYYQSKQPTGARRLLEMTAESAFWTRNLYTRMRNAVLSVLIPAAFGLLLIISVSLMIGRIPNTELVHAVYLVIPILISADFIGLSIRAHRSVQSVSDIEKSLESISQQGEPQLAEVMRLVSEYNCVASSGLVIPDWFYSRYREHIQRLWDQ